MDIGFTGTQLGMTLPQKEKVRSVLYFLQPDRARHGMCKGADAEFHDICRTFPIFIVGHPGVDSQGRSPSRAKCVVDLEEAELPYLERDTIIVQKCHILLATPKGYVEELRSGTWATIRRGRKILRTTMIIYPDGSTGE